MTCRLSGMAEEWSLRARTGVRRHAVGLTPTEARGCGARCADTHTIRTVKVWDMASGRCWSRGEQQRAGVRAVFLRYGERAGVRSMTSSSIVNSCDCGSDGQLIASGHQVRRCAPVSHIAGVVVAALQLIRMLRAVCVCVCVRVCVCVCVCACVYVCVCVPGWRD